MTDHDASTPAAVGLADGFPPVDQEQWLGGVRKVLFRGRQEPTDDEFEAAFGRRLVTRTEDGIELQPLYTAENQTGDAGFPGVAPYVRSTHAAPRQWEIRQRVVLGDPESSAVAELESGATGVLVEVAPDSSTDALDRTLDGVHLELAPVSVSVGHRDAGFGAARSLLDVWERRGTPTDGRMGTLGVDPVGAWLRSGGTTDIAADLAASADLVATALQQAPSARVLVSDGTVWHDAGASDGQELAWTLAGAAAMVRALVDAGVDRAVAFASIEFRFAANADQFATITKLRAARGLWARIAEIAEAGVEAGRMFQHADGSQAMLTRYDPWVNALRSTVACFAAAVGGADAITIAPHDVLVADGGTAGGRRTARNTQTVLMLESHLAEVVDLAGGSWYVESRTDAVADAAWAELQRVEALGGIVAAVEEGAIHEALDRTLAGRAKALATRRQPLTGLSEFPNIAEQPPDPSPVVASDGTETPFAPLGLRRYSDAFEHQRGRTDAMQLASGSRPAVFLATLGSPAAWTARATFAKNFFEVAGIRTVEGTVDEFDPELTPFACVCSSDPVYREDGATAVSGLRAAGATRIYLAGRGLGLDGVDEEVGLGSDVLDTLTRALDELGVPA